MNCDGLGKRKVFEAKRDVFSPSLSNNIILN